MELTINDIAKLLNESGYPNPDIRSEDENPNDVGIAIGYKSIPKFPNIPGLNINLHDNKISLNTVINMGSESNMSLAIPGMMGVMGTVSMCRCYILPNDSVIDHVDQVTKDNLYVCIEVEQLLSNNLTKREILDWLELMIELISVSMCRFDEAVKSYIKYKSSQSSMTVVKPNKILS